MEATDVRNNARNIWDSREEAANILQRIQDYLPKEWKGRKLVELNERYGWENVVSVFKIYFINVLSILQGMTQYCVMN